MRAKSRLEHWKSKLIDLSLRNKLLNYRPGHSAAVPIVAEIPRVVVERLLNEERSLGFDPRPEEGPIPEGGEVFKPVPEEELEPRHVDSALQTTLGPRKLDKVLYNLYLKSRTSLEEQGIVTLFLAVGMLRWYEDRNAEEARLAPILLLPVVLSRKGVGRPFTLAAAPVEPEVNPSLLRKLEVDFGAEPALPENGDGIDPDAVLEAFRRVLPDPRWQVLSDMHLGLFSFSKYVMYRDLEDQTEALLENRNVARLAGEATEPLDLEPVLEPGEFPRRPPITVHQILDADSSQQAAIETVRRGHDLVLQGPPGTGKSQTIANIVAETLADGKTVLFVSEKMAALEVVRKRLSRAGLRDYVLELHSRHTVKREVVAELTRCLKRDRLDTPADTGELDRLVQSREELDRYVAALHEPFGAGGLTPFDAFGALARNEEAPDLLFELPEPEESSRDERAARTRLVDDLALAREGVEPAQEHPWRFSRLTSVPRAVELEIGKVLGDLRDHAADLTAALTAGAERLGLSAQKTLGDAHARIDLLRHLTRSPGPEPAWIADPHWPGAGTEGRAVIGKLRKFAEGREKLARTWTESLFDLALDDLAERRAHHGTGFFRLLRPSWWRDRKLLSTVLRPGAGPDAAQIIEDLDLAVRVRNLGSEIDHLLDRGEEIFGRFFKARETDWEELDSMAAWVARLRELSPAQNLPEELTLAAKTPRDFDEPLAVTEKTLKRVESDLAALATLLKNKDLPEAIDTLSEMADGALMRREGIHDQAAWRRALEAARDAGLASFVSAGREAGLPAKALAPAFEKGFAMLFLDRARAARKILGDFHREHHEETIGRFRDLDRRQLDLAVGRIRGRLDADRPSSRSFSPESDVGLLLREAAKKRRHLPIRKLLQKAGAAVRRLKPCLMMSPLSIAQYLPVGSEPFDLVIFDEASQICPEDAIGAIARGRQVVVVGDSRQLPPTSFFSYDPDLMEDEEAEDPMPDLESILDLCATSGLPSLRLRWHYRSRDEGLIAFSNHHFYEGSLFTFPNPARRPGLGVEFHHVADGVYDRGGTRTNRIEARAVAAAVADQVRAHPEQSVGVVTFSEAQQRAVLEELDALLKADPELEELLARQTEEPAFVKNLENVQGDERDVMFFSIGYGRDATGKLTMNFGPLNGDGGHRRLNVAVTRAKRAVHVFASILPEDIDPARAKASGARLLRNYLEYAARGVRALEREDAPEKKIPESLFEVALARAIEEEGLMVERKIGASAYRLDLGIKDPENEQTLVLGIECDGPTYRDAATTRDRDRTRPVVLEGLGWQLHRVWSPDWVRSPRREIERIREAIAINDRPPPPPPPPPPVAVFEVEDGPDREASADSDRSEGLPAAPPYEITPRGQRRPRRPFDVESGELPRLVSAIVAHEGPIHMDDLSRRIADSYDTRRTGKVREGTERGVELAAAEGKLVRRGDFLWPPGRTACALRGPAKGESPRAVEHVPDEEIEDGIKTVLEVDLRLPRGALTKALATLLGHRRTSDRIEDSVGGVIDRMAARGALTVEDDLVALVGE
jgi:very-short-patch-repair endonuclease